MVKYEKKEMSWFVRKADLLKDKRNIIDFFRSYIWASEDGNALYSWKYEQNPAGPALICIAISEEDDRVICSGVMMPWEIQVDGRVVTSAQGVDALTDRDYRRKGIFKRLASQVLSELNKMDISFAFAFPNEKSLGGMLKIGWYEVGSVLRWTKVLKAKYALGKVIGENVISKSLGFFVDVWLRLVSRKRAYRPSSRYVIKEIREFDERFDILWERVSSSFKVIGVRDSKYLNWKYVNTPINKPDIKQIVFSIEKDSDLAGYIVLELGEMVSYIVDIFTEQDDELIDHLIAYIVKYLRTRGILAASFIALEGNPYVSYLKKFGFYLRPDKSSFVVYISPDSSNRSPRGIGDSPYAILCNHKNWFITDGDWDMVSHR